MGGCVRLPRKVGVATALDLILTGKTLTGERAYKSGLADAFFPRQNFEESRSEVGENQARGSEGRQAFRQRAQARRNGWSRRLP